MILLIVSGINLLLAIVILFQFKSAQKELNEKTNLVEELIDLISDHAKFMDRNGRADEHYDSREVLAHWNKFHDIVRRFRGKG